MPLILFISFYFYHKTDGVTNTKQLPIYLS